MGHLAVKSIARDTRGGLAITTALTGMMLMVVTGAALDSARMVGTKQKLQAMTDLAALNAAMPEHANTDARRKLAVHAINTQHAQLGGGLSLNEPRIDVRTVEEQVYVELSADVPMLFGAVIGNGRRTVSAASTAEHRMHASIKATSISLVLDLSSSMSENLDAMSKLASVRAAASEVFAMIEAEFGGEVAAKTQLSTGVYPFNWGKVGNKTVPLAPGTNEVITAISYLSTADGSVPTTAMEQAVLDQIAEANVKGGRDRFIIYVTDGRVEDDKDDLKGDFVDAFDLFETNNKSCKSLLKDIAKIDKSLAKNGGDNDDDDDDDDDDEVGDTFTSALTALNATSSPVELDLLLSNDSHADHNHTDQNSLDRAKRVELHNAFIEMCRPQQSMRVIRACEQARERDISIIGINLSGEDGEGSNIVDLCVNGVGESDVDNGKTKKKNGSPDPSTPQGEVMLSVDGTSVSGDVSSLAELRRLMRSVLPDKKAQRTVRLVD